MANLAAIHVGQPDIKDDDVEIILFRQFQGLGSGLGTGGRKLLMQLQLLAQHFEEGRVVINNEDSFAGGHGFPINCFIFSARMRKIHLISIR